MDAELPKGFYTGPDGAARFWDGENWYDQTPEQAAAHVASPGLARRLRIPIVIVVVLLLLGAGAFAVKTNVDAQNSAAAATAALAVAEQNKADQVAIAAKQAEDARVAASTAAKAEADQQQAEQDALDAQQAIDDTERASRAKSVKGVEKSVLKMARDDAARGFTRGPIKSVNCVPIAGGSTDDLTQATMKFECFAVYKTNKDGTTNGYYYNATMNWDDGSYTYGYGRS
jgi:hypothetical protein